jgi:hypothetical protein
VLSELGGGRDVAARMHSSILYRRDSMKWWRRPVLVLATIALVSVALGRIAAQDDKPPSIEDIMTKAHKGGNSLIASVGKGLRTPTPDWDSLHQKTQELVTLGSALGKNTPPKGEKASWDKLTSLYVTNAHKLDEAVAEKNKNDATAAHRRLTGSCKTCHNAHKPD